jgi:hypothetical protein
LLLQANSTNTNPQNNNRFFIVIKYIYYLK